jgi:hypothetical protein
VTGFYPRAHGYATAKEDPFALHMADNPQLKALYLDAEHEDHYWRDQSVFSDGITIEDTLSVLVKYQNQCQLSYSLNTYLPWEGLNVVFNGSEGRLEMKIVEKSYVNAGGERANEGSLESCNITVFPMFAAPWRPVLPSAKAVTAAVITRCLPICSARRVTIRSGVPPITVPGQCRS